jgi:hypothetical protein
VNRAFLSALALGSAAVAATPVLASPAPVDAGRAAAATVVVSLPDGDRLSLGLRAVAGQSADRLLVSTTRCDDDACLTGEFSGLLPEHALTIDPSTADATLTVEIGGHVLAITWRSGDTSTAVLGGVAAGGKGGSVQASTYDGAPAAVTVDFLGATCHGDGAVGNGAVVDTSDTTGTPATRAVSALKIRAGATLHC